MKKWILIFGLTLSILKQSSATTYIPCGEKNGDEKGNCWPCGETCSARLTYPSEQDKANHKNATLTFSGNDSMYNYESPSNNPRLTGVEPWYGVANQIVKVVVEDGITSIGNRTIYAMSNLKDVSLPDSIETIGGYAFNGAKSLSIINIPENVKKIDDYAFNSTSHLTALSLPESLFQQGSTLKNNILSNTGITGLYCPKAYEQKCRQILKGSGFKDLAVDNILKLYTKSDSEYFYGGKFYKSAGDIAAKNHIKKRIYTIDEANEVAGPINRILIKYR